MNALNAYNRLNVNVSGMKKASEKLSSGYRINRAGDDAAGLAISEKMRSQIRGLGQAKRNAQDGISMIQTFEGAAQESHSILQRMKELATESANGTYDNRTDRAAIQLEFDQLNDELNQIADTDYNGTIVLNGGEMSDGLKVGKLTDGLGEFNYLDKAAQVQKETTEKIDALKAEKAKLNAPADIFKTAKNRKEELVWNTLDEEAYDLDAAVNLWDDTNLGLDRLKDTYVNVTFVVDSVDDDGKATYKAESGVTSQGATLTTDQLAKFGVTTASRDDATGYGGFDVTAGGATVKAIFDATNVKKGDVLTIQFKGPGEAEKAPDHAGIGDDSLKFFGTDGTTAKDSIKGTTVPTVTLDDGLTDDAMTQKIKDTLDIFNGATVSVKAAAGSAAVTAPNNISFTAADGSSVTVENTGAVKKGTDVVGFLTVGTGGEAGKVTFSTANAAGTAKETDLFQVDMSALFDTSVAVNEIGSFSIHFDSYAMPGDAGVDAEAIETDLGAENKAIQAKIDDIDKQIKDLEDGVLKGVSKSDAFDNSRAIMNYAENITLQTGARTKDAVKFTFNYNMDKTADMGDLKANLNLSSREGGLETAGLSLATAEDANHAMDQIDKAINKVSMVRASFGAIQNRLEHKIDNLTTTNENLTEAESNIRDTDMASEMMNYTKFNILQQAAQSMLAQANQQPQSILQLLG